MASQPTRHGRAHILRNARLSLTSTLPRAHTDAMLSINAKRISVRSQEPSCTWERPKGDAHPRGAEGRVRAERVESYIASCGAGPESGRSKIGTDRSYGYAMGLGKGEEKPRTAWCMDGLDSSSSRE